MNKIAVIIFAFTREESLFCLLNSIKRNKGYEEFNYFFFVDGPRNKKDSHCIEGVVDIIDKFNVQNKNIKISKTNRGLSKSILSGISEVSETFDSFIVLEDDLVLSEFFFSFMKGALKQFKDNEKIINISGFSNLPLTSVNSENYYLCRRSTSWGWASWSHKWRKIDFNDENFYSISCFLKLLLISPDLPFMLRNQKNGVIDSWAIRLVAYQAISNKFSLTPIESHVINMGTDEHATNVDLIHQSHELSTSETNNLYKIKKHQFYIDAFKWLFELFLYFKRLKQRILKK